MHTGLPLSPLSHFCFQSQPQRYLAILQGFSEEAEGTEQRENTGRALAEQAGGLPGSVSPLRPLAWPPRGGVAAAQPSPTGASAGPALQPAGGGRGGRSPCKREAADKQRRLRPCPGRLCSCRKGPRLTAAEAGRRLLLTRPGDLNRLQVPHGKPARPGCCTRRLAATVATQRPRGLRVTQAETCVV